MRDQFSTANLKNNNQHTNLQLDSIFQHMTKISKIMSKVSCKNYFGICNEIANLLQLKKDILRQ